MKRIGTALAAMLVISGPAVADDYLDAIRELGKESTSIGTDLLHNAGVRYLLLNDQHLTRKEFKRRYGELGRSGRIRLIFVAVRGNPLSFPINYMSKVCSDSKRDACERWMARSASYLMEEFSARYVAGNGSTLTRRPRSGRSYHSGNERATFSVHEKLNKDLIIDVASKKSVEAVRIASMKGVCPLRSAYRGRGGGRGVVGGGRRRKSRGLVGA